MEKRLNKKRAYSRPELDVIEVDNEISLMMFSEPNPPGAAVEGGESGPLGSSSGDSYFSSEENNPFGGSSPDYSN